MSEQKLIEIQRRHHELWNAGEMDALRDLYQDDVVMHHLEGWPEPGPTVGRDAVFRQFERLRESWQGERLEILELCEVGDCVVTSERWVAKGGYSDVPAELRLSAVVRFRDGKIAAVAFHWDHAQALADARSESLPGRVPADSR